MAAVSTILAATLAGASVAHGVEQSRMMKREAKKQQEVASQQNAKMESELAQQKSNEAIDKQNLLLRMSAQKRARAAATKGDTGGGSALTSNVGTQGSGGKTLLGQ